MIRSIVVATLAGLILLSAPATSRANGVAKVAVAANAPNGGVELRTDAPLAGPAMSQTYEAREASAKGLEKFEGGRVVVLAGSGLVIVLLIVLIIVLV